MRQNKTIGSILLDVELVTQEDIEQALEIQKQRGKRLGEVLVQLGVVSDDDIRWALAEQLNLPYVNIRKDQVDVEVATLLPEKLARRYHVIPILKIDNELTVVVDDPLNTTIINDIERITRADVKISLGRTSDILLAIDEIYGSSEERIAPEEEAPPKFLSSWFQEEEIQKILNDPSGQVLMEQILSQALEHGVSRIYFQPGFERCHISYRINGVLQEQLQLNKEWYAILLFRLKIYADFEMATLRYPQYREFSYQDSSAASQEAETHPATTLAVSITPIASGEAAVLHVIHKSVARLWERLHQDTIPELQEQELTEVYALQTEINRRKTGAILLGGSPYFDKMTTLYAISGELDPIRKRIVALEHNSEYRAGNYYQINYAGDEYRAIASLDDTKRVVLHDQSQHSSQIRTFPRSAAADIRPPSQRRLSAWLDVVNTHDTDVLLVDHIESDIVLSQCLDFAGHGLLFASLDFPNVFQMLMYLRDCQVKSSVLSSRVQALVAQQSVRKLCQNCRQPDSTEQGKQVLEDLVRQEDDESPPSELWMPQGCPECHMSGYTQSVVLYEILRIENWLQDILLRGASLQEIQTAAEEHAFQSLKKKATALLLSGQTSLEEVFSILT